MKALRSLDVLMGPAFRLNCAACPRQHKCEEFPSAGTGYDWEEHPALAGYGGRCPVAWLNDPEMVAAIQIHRASQVSSLAGWPHEFPAWLEEYVVEVGDAIAQMKSRAARRAMGGS